MDLERARKWDVEGRVYEILEKAEETQVRLNAAVTFVDPREQLKELETTDADAVMYGTPVVLEDNVSTKEIRTAASSRILDSYTPMCNAHVVGKLQTAGVVVIAKASIDEPDMGGTNRNTYTGSVNNARDESRISGRNSGGSATFVAAGIVPFAIDTDVDDSVRKPAAYQGIIDMRPIYGGTSRCSIVSYASSLGHVGYFTISVQDTTVALGVLAGCDDRDMTSSNRAVGAYATSLNHDLRGKRTTALDDVQEAVTGPAIRENFDTLTKKLETCGITVIHVRIDDKLMKALMPTYYIIANAEATTNHSNLGGIRFDMREAGENVEDVMINIRTKSFCSHVRKRFVIGSYSLFVRNQGKALREAQKVHRLTAEELNRVLVNSDVVIASAVETITPLAEESRDPHLGADDNAAENHVALGNFSGYSSMTMPTDFAEGISTGINMTVKAFDEQTLFNIGLAIEEEAGSKGNDVEADT